MLPTGATFNHVEQGAHLYGIDAGVVCHGVLGSTGSKFFSPVSIDARDSAWRERARADATFLDPSDRPVQRRPYRHPPAFCSLLLGPACNEANSQNGPDCLLHLDHRRPGKTNPLGGTSQEISQLTAV